MRMAAVSWSLLVAQVCLAIVVGGEPPLAQEHCLTGCECSQPKTVICYNLVHTSLDSLLLNIPEDTEKIIVDGCAMTRIMPPRINHVFQNIHYLQLKSCHIRAIVPDAFLFMPNLKELHLNNNKLQSVDFHDLLHLQNVEVINLLGNQISSIGDGAFRSLPHLRELVLSGNNLTHINTGVFQNLNNLEHADLSHNMIWNLHPYVISGLHLLKTINLKSNLLDSMQSTMFNNMTNLQSVFLSDNRWNCHCGLQWLHTDLQDSNKHSLYTDGDDIRCSSPREFEFMPLSSIRIDDLVCQEPQLGAVPSDMPLPYLHTSWLHCNASGTPQPSVYWLTPHGTIVHPSHQKWLPLEAAPFSDQLVYAGQPTFYESFIIAHANGTLELRQFRGYYSGDYTCVAENPAGEHNITVTIVISSRIRYNVWFSVGVGGMAAAGFLFLSLIFGLVRLAIMRIIFKHELKKLANGTIIVEAREDENFDDIDFDNISLYSRPDYRDDDDKVSPMKCVTPAEAGDDDEEEGQMASRIRETLEDARSHLTVRMSSQVDKIRNRASLMRESSSRYMQKVRSSGGYYVHNLRDAGSRKLYHIRESASGQFRSIRASSSQYASRVRTGVSISMEQVKYHVQSMKEYCGTGGDISHTISTISVATDIDSQEKSEVVRTVTYV